MGIKSELPKGRENILPSLNVAIDALNLAKDMCSITPAKAVFDSVSALLTMVRVRFFRFRDDELRAHIHRPGFYDQRTGLRRARAELRRCLYRSRPGIERETSGRAQSVGVSGNSAIDYVG